MNNKNELVNLQKLSNKIDVILRNNKENNIFPLSPTHRKELRKLKNVNVGNLRTQIQIIKTDKLNKYLDYHKNKEIKIKDDYKKFNEMYNKIKNNYLEGFKKLKECYEKKKDEKI